MSGGDLDGDKFFVCWDEDLIPPRTEEPTSYQGKCILYCLIFLYFVLIFYSNFFSTKSRIIGSSVCLKLLELSSALHWLPLMEACAVLL